MIHIEIKAKIIKVFKQNFMKLLKDVTILITLCDNLHKTKIKIARISNKSYLKKQQEVQK